ncbi:hypothetical protein FHS21_005613 [Phyllobacterium trifolii]|uniref:Uncharacterized protein n=1 Tax=Phyllobacterium trifolii TaxID=300193 RepID=A0A839UKL6_9HYPH|nr:hypothetical protein [Phyllobacterium trifolii]
MTAPGAEAGCLAMIDVPSPWRNLIAARFILAFRLPPNPAGKAHQVETSDAGNRQGRDLPAVCHGKGCAARSAW